MGTDPDDNITRAMLRRLNTEPPVSELQQNVMDALDNFVLDRLGAGLPPTEDELLGFAWQATELLKAANAPQGR